VPCLLERCAVGKYTVHVEIDINIKRMCTVDAIQTSACSATWGTAIK